MAVKPEEEKTEGETDRDLQIHKNWGGKCSIHAYDKVIDLN